MRLKNLNITKLALSTGVLAFSFLFTSCNKDDSDTGVSQEIPKSTLTKIAKSIPKVKLADNSDKRTFVDNQGVTYVDNGDGFTFANSNGPTFSTSSGLVFSEEAGRPVAVLDPSSSGLGGGGTVVAGETSLDIDIAVCFGADEEGLGIGPDFGFDGVSAVFGISGDFESLLNEDQSDDSDPEDFFDGFAAYMIFDDNADGTYDVLNLDELEAEEEPTGISFAYVLDAKKGIMYISKSGKLTVSGGSISFSGDYYVLDFSSLDEDSDDFESLEDNWKVVSGFGQMGCDQ